MVPGGMVALRGGEMGVPDASLLEFAGGARVSLYSAANISWQHPLANRFIANGGK